MNLLLVMKILGRHLLKCILFLDEQEYLISIMSVCKIQTADKLKAKYEATRS